MTIKRRHPVLWTPVGTDSVHAGTALFRARQGHGFAAERANHLSDLIAGENARLVAGDNVKNGPDRIVNGQTIQTKYHQSGARGVANCFRGGRYRYFNSDGTPMPVEVPRDQYDAALEAMERRILEHRVPGLEDPADAARLVRQGSLTYRQAVNVARFGTIDSLSYDAVNGVRVGGIALGVSATVAYALAVWRGESLDEALGAAWSAGARVGGVAWSTSVLAAQFGRTRLGALVGANALTAAAATVVLSCEHLTGLVRGEVSGAQCFKEVATTTASVVGGVAGWQLGIRLGGRFGPVAAILGGLAAALIASNVSGSATRALLDAFVDDDADDMIAVAQTVFERLAFDYLLTDDEAVHVAQEFVSADLPATLRRMYAATDRVAFAEARLLPLVENQVEKRQRILLRPDG